MKNKSKSPTISTQYKNKSPRIYFYLFFRLLYTKKKNKKTKKKQSLKDKFTKMNFQIHFQTKNQKLISLLSN